VEDDKKKNQVRGRVYTLNAEEVYHSKDLIQGMGLIKSKPVNILFDSGATYSFISVDCARQVYFPVSKLPYEVLVSTPSEEKICTTTMCYPIFLYFQRKTFCLDLYYLLVKGLDGILGMDWLKAHKFKIDCATKTGHIPDRGLEIYCTHHPTLDLHNLSMYDDGPRYLVVCVSDAKKSVNVDSLPVVRDFPEVFPDDIESLPPKKEVEFSIELVPGDGPVSKAPYRMALLELVEVKRQIEELM
jgi:hypothetical protein